MFKRYGFTMPKLCAYGNNFVEYRWLSTMFGFAFALLFSNIVLAAWTMLFYLVGNVAEIVGKVALKAGFVLSGLLVVVAISDIVTGSGFWLSYLLMAMLTAGLAYEGIARKKLLKS